MRLSPQLDYGLRTVTTIAQDGRTRPTPPTQLRVVQGSTRERLERGAVILPYAALRHETAAKYAVSVR